MYLLYRKGDIRDNKESYNDIKLYRVPKPPAVVSIGTSGEAECWSALTVLAVPPAFPSAGRVAEAVAVHTPPLEAALSREVRLLVREWLRVCCQG